MLRKIIVVTLTDFGVKYQNVFTQSKLACETMVSWVREIAKEYDMSFDEFNKIENDIRTSCYYGSENDINIDLGKYQISYREFKVEFFL